MSLRDHKQRRFVTQPGRYLVTGGAGFIGSAIVHALVCDGREVRVLDNFSTGLRRNLSEVADQIELLEGSVVDLQTCRRAVEGIDFILHQAAIPSVPRSLKDPFASHQANVTGTLSLLLAACKAGCRRFVYASSSSVYGDTEVLPKIETMRPEPRSPYAVSKLAGEHYVRTFPEMSGLETVALRYFNVFGPRQNPDSAYAGVIARWVAAALAGEPVTVHGDGLQSRDFTFIDNVVAANLASCSAPEAAGQVINIGAGERYTLLDLLAALEQVTGKPIARTHVDPRPGDVRHSQADITRANRLLGYAPRISLRDGLQETLAWRQAQMKAPANCVAST